MLKSGACCERRLAIGFLLSIALCVGSCHSLSDTTQGTGSAASDVEGLLGSAQGTRGIPLTRLTHAPVFANLTLAQQLKNLLKSKAGPLLEQNSQSVQPTLAIVATAALPSQMGCRKDAEVRTHYVTYSNNWDVLFFEGTRSSQAIVPPTLTPFAVVRGALGASSPWLYKFDSEGRLTPVRQSDSVYVVGAFPISENAGWMVGWPASDSAASQATAAPAQLFFAPKVADLAFCIASVNDDQASPLTLGARLSPSGMGCVVAAADRPDGPLGFHLFPDKSVTSALHDYLDHIESTLAPWKTHQLSLGSPSDATQEPPSTGVAWATVRRTLGLTALALDARQRLKLDDGLRAQWFNTVATERGGAEWQTKYAEHQKLYASVATYAKGGLDERSYSDALACHVRIVGVRPRTAIQASASTLLFQDEGLRIARSAVPCERSETEFDWSRPACQQAARNAMAHLLQVYPRSSVEADVYSGMATPIAGPSFKIGYATGPDALNESLFPAAIAIRDDCASGKVKTYGFPDIVPAHWTATGQVQWLPPFGSNVEELNLPAAPSGEPVEQSPPGEGLWIKFPHGPF